MHLIILIPCLNEADQIGETMSTIPRDIAGFDKVEILVIDDGSTDETVEKARAAGADHIYSNPINLGLARTFVIGLEQALLRGADVIVNFDADNQYPARYIPDLTRPILEDRAEMSIGARPITEIDHFSPVKRRLQRLGSWVVRKASGQNVPDAPSGFRAISAAAASRLYTFSKYSYTIETIIQAGRLNMNVVSVPIEVNPPTRPSRLMRSTAGYIWKSILTIFRIGILYYPFRIFFLLSILFLIPGTFALLRFVYYFLVDGGAGHIQSVIIGTGLFAIGFVLMVAGILADLISANRTLLQDIRARELDEKVRRLRG